MTFIDGMIIDLKSIHGNTIELYRKNGRWFQEGLENYCFTSDERLREIMDTTEWRMVR